MPNHITFAGTYDTTAYVKPEDQASISLRNDDGTATAAATPSYSQTPLGGAVTVSTTPVHITVPASYSNATDILLIENTDASIAVFARDSATVAATGATRGHQILAGGSLDFPIGRDGASIWLVTAAGSVTVVWSAL